MTRTAGIRMMHMHCFQQRGVLLVNFHSYARIGIRYRSVGKLYSLSFLVILFSETGLPMLEVALKLLPTVNHPYGYRLRQALRSSLKYATKPIKKMIAGKAKKMASKGVSTTRLKYSVENSSNVTSFVLTAATAVPKASNPSKTLRRSSTTSTKARRIRSNGVSFGRRRRKLRYGFASGRYGAISGAVLAPTTNNITPKPTRTRPGRVAAKVRLNRPDLCRSCITVRSTPVRLSTAPMRLASSLGCISISPPAPGGKGIIVKYNPLRYKLSSSLHLELGGCGALGHRAAAKNPS